MFSGLLFLLAILSAVGGGDGGDPGSTYSPLPLLFAEGTHYEIGFQIVRTLVALPISIVFALP